MNTPLRSNHREKKMLTAPAADLKLMFEISGDTGTARGALGDASAEQGGPKGIGSNGAGFIQPRPMSSLYLIRQVCALKTWARKNGVNEAKDGTMSSYVLTLLMINYLQAI